MEHNKDMLENKAVELNDEELGQVTGGVDYQSGSTPKFPAGSTVAYTEEYGATYIEAEQRFIPKYRSIETTVCMAAKLDGVYHYNLANGAMKLEYELRLVKKS